MHSITDLFDHIIQAISDSFSFRNRHQKNFKSIFFKFIREIFFHYKLKWIIKNFWGEIRITLRYKWRINASTRFYTLRWTILYYHSRCVFKSRFRFNLKKTIDYLNYSNSPFWLISPLKLVIIYCTHSWKQTLLLKESKYKRQIILISSPFYTINNFVLL